MHGRSDNSCEPKALYHKPRTEGDKKTERQTKKLKTNANRFIGKRKNEAPGKMGLIPRATSREGTSCTGGQKRDKINVKSLGGAPTDQVWKKKREPFKKGKDAPQLPRMVG